jgi:hypothetical protein
MILITHTTHSTGRKPRKEITMAETTNVAAKLFWYEMAGGLDGDTGDDIQTTQEFVDLMRRLRGDPDRTWVKDVCWDGIDDGDAYKQVITHLRSIAIN